MYAIVRVGGRQYKAEVGKTFVTEKLPSEVGDEITLDDVLMIRTDKGVITIGQPTVEGASVTAKVVDQYKGKKIIVFKYRSRKRYRVKSGHRQRYTRLEVIDIAAGS